MGELIASAILEFLIRIAIQNTNNYIQRVVTDVEEHIGGSKYVQHYGDDYNENGYLDPDEIIGMICTEKDEDGNIVSCYGVDEDENGELDPGEIQGHISYKADDKTVSVSEDTNGNGVQDSIEVKDTMPIGSNTSTIIVNPDGTMTIYDETGSITEEDCDNAYALWVSENGIMNKSLDDYSVTEGLLLLSVLSNCFFIIKSLFSRKDVFRYGLK